MASKSKKSKRGRTSRVRSPSRTTAPILATSITPSSASISPKGRISGPSPTGHFPTFLRRPLPKTGWCLAGATNWFIASSGLMAGRLRRQAHHEHRFDTPAGPAAADPKGNHGRQLLCLKLPAVFLLETGTAGGIARRAGTAAEAGHAARDLPAHPVLPEAVPLLLFSGLHRQGLGRHSRLHQRGDQGTFDLRRGAVHRRAEARLHL